MLNTIYIINKIILLLYKFKLNYYIIILRDIHFFLNPILLKKGEQSSFYSIVFSIGIKKASRTGIKLIGDMGCVLRVARYGLSDAGANFGWHY
jgi:hypothetical protein